MNDSKVQNNTIPKSGTSESETVTFVPVPVSTETTTPTTKTSNGNGSNTGNNGEFGKAKFDEVQRTSGDSLDSEKLRKEIQELNIKPTISPSTQVSPSAQLTPNSSSPSAQVSPSAIKLAIGVPCYGGVGMANFFICLTNTISVLKSQGIEAYPIFMLGDSLITRARNNIVAKFLNDPTATHLIFIDSDITWNPVEVIKLLRHNTDIVGGIYPLKTYKWDKLESKSLEEIKTRHSNSLNTKISEQDFIRQNLMKYNLNYKYAEFKVVNNLVEVKHIATGFMMINRRVFDKMMKEYPKSKYRDNMGALTKDEDRFAFNLFHVDVVDEMYLSEDHYFCHLWTQLGGSIFADVTINLTHIGPHNFEGRFLSSLNVK